MKKKLISVIVIIVTLLLLVSSIISYANTSETIYINLAKVNAEGIGYAIDNPITSSQAHYIWNLVTYNSNNVSDISAKQRNLYCIKANYGNSWITNETQIVPYNLSYDLQDDIEKLRAIVDNSNGADDVVKALLNPDNSTKGYYRELLWILDNLYIENQTDKNAFLENIGFKYNSELKSYMYVPTNQYDYSDLISATIKSDGCLEEYLITDEDIKAVQKAAIWYYTNYMIDDEEDFNNKTVTDWLNITTDGGSNYKELSAISSDTNTIEGISRNDQAIVIYNYLIDSAAKNADKYTETNGYKINGAPANINTSGLTEKNGKYVIETQRQGVNYLVGPIKIDRNNDMGYDIAITVKDHTGKTLENGTDYIYTDKDGKLLQDISTIKDLVEIPNGFYISVPRSTIESINITVDISYVSTPKKLWLKGTEDADGIKLVEEQPIVEVTQDPQKLTVELISQPQEFDLALRKYITAVNGTNVTNTRVPNIELNTLQTGTTATYRHRKDPLLVEDKDEVTYNITIYNEGNKTGYATKIIDQLPTGLVSSTNNSSVVISKGPDGKERNQYKLQYDTKNNQIILTMINLPEELNQNESQDGEIDVQDIQPYKQGKLDYETIEIKCMVAQEPDTKEQIVLTNVAWIASAFDSEANVEILTQGQDRDSEPQTSPNVNKGNMEDYKGNKDNKNNLADSSYFYEGEQDDDDFEKLVIMPVEKVFDLALFKHIAAISKDQIIENGEYVTDTGNVDGTYLRAPVVTAIDADTGKITYKQDDKEALTVEPGDYVLYTIRVYNEGEIDGYASKIKDTLPIGLEFVVGNEEYNGIWKLEGLDEDGKQVVTTTWYAKGQGAELNAKEGEANYKANLLRALNKEAQISKENPDYIDAQVLCKVVEQATSDRVLVNYAQISEDSDENGNPIDDIDSTPDEWKDGDDDQDIERIKLQCFDLSLRKFITSINGVELKNSNGKYTREPVVNVSNLVNKTGTTAEYVHPKTPVSVQVGDKVVYTIRVYNEGDINGFASEVKDYLPPYLTYVKDSEINSKYGWQISQDGRIVSTKFLENTELKAFNEKELDYADLKIECIVSESAPLKQNQTNIAEISEYKYNGNTVPKDIDSTADNNESKIPNDENLPEYKNDEINKSYVPGNEDDDDFEKVYVREFDLALRKFITQIQDKSVTTRVPEVKIENGTISYNHPKDPVTVHVGDVVIYTLRIYNEGEISGYANEITDDIPEYLEYLPTDNVNVEYMWEMYDENNEITQNVEEAVKIKTTYLSKENGEDNLINAFDGTTLSYKDIKVAFKVKDPNSNTHIITNHAQISDDTDENGMPIEDKDSQPDKWNEGEDDQDIENVKVEYFDLSLLKFVSKVIVIEDGKETITETGYNGHENPEPVVKVELHKKKLDKVAVKFGYGITITNEGDIPGYATEITDYVPEGLRFEASDNPLWKDEGNNVISTKQLENTLLQPGESKTIEVIFTWINGSDNLALKTNTAEISEDKNEYNVPDKDSTPDNKKDGEDDIDIAKVILAISTGTAKTYFTLAMGLLTIILVGIVLIKKFVI